MYAFEQWAGEVGSAKLEGELSGQQESPGAVGRDRTQCGSTFESVDGDGVCSPFARPLGGLVQLPGNLRIVAEYSGSPMPQAAICVFIEDLTQGPVSGESLGHRRGLIDGRGHQRMSEPNLWTDDLDEVGAFHHGQHIWGDGPTEQQLGRGHDLPQFGALVCCGDEQHAAGVIAQVDQTRRKGLLQAGGKRERLADAPPVIGLVDGRELEKRERIARGQSQHVAKTG